MKKSTIKKIIGYVGFSLTAILLVLCMTNSDKISDYIVQYFGLNHSSQITDRNNAYKFTGSELQDLKGLQRIK
jgi:hypothetical protein